MTGAAAPRELDRDGELVVVRTRRLHPGEQLELRGELPHWHEAIALAPRAGGAEATLRLGPGIYEYKLRDAADRWRLDPDNPRTRQQGDARNNLLVVGGAAEPLLHAPVAPWLFAEPDGRVVVRVGLRRGAGDGLRLRWSEGDGPRTTAMRPIGDEAEHRLFEATLPGAGATLEYHVELADGRVLGAAGGGGFRAERAELADRRPAWWHDAVLYSIFVDRFRRGGGALAPGWTRDHHAGGDLDGVREALPYLADLGVTALHLTPVVVSPSVHRYDAIDPQVVAPELGGEAAFARLCDEATRRGLRILCDVTLTHVHRDFARFREVRERGPRAAAWSWFRPLRWPFVDGPEPGYQHFHKGRWELPLLATDEAEVQAYLCDTARGWIERGASGIRLDAAADVPVPLCRDLAAAVRHARRDAIVFAELVPEVPERYAAAVDAATSFAWRDGVAGFATGERAGPEVAARFARLRRRRGPAAAAIGFAGSHDHVRVASQAGAGRALLTQLAVIFGDGVPLLYYGDELGLASAGGARELDDAWPDRLPMAWADAAGSPSRAIVQRALALRAAHPALRRGTLEPLATDDPTVLGFVRTLGTASFAVVLARADVPRTLTLAPGQLRFAVGEVALADDRLQLGPASAAVVELGTAADLELGRGNADLALLARELGELAVPSLPVRLLVTVTEACNLRCAHCITDAPARTRSGRARTLRPWLLDALAEGFGHADQVSFSHGGESLVAPIFDDVVRAASGGRAGRPGRTEIHLVSNGSRLPPDRLAALADLGLTSLMISIDGASAATHDRIRIGSSFDAVVGNLGALLARRREAGLDLRIGVSTVVGRRNAGEIGALAARLADLGVDWLKLEETYPATPFARGDALAADEPPLLDAVAAARAASRGVVVVDHTRAWPCPCQPDAGADARRFRAADDFAHRADLAPCRAAWEHAAIDPDGTVHAVDYAGPPLGNLVDRDLLSLWNAPAAQAQRREALRASHGRPPCPPRAVA